MTEGTPEETTVATAANVVDDPELLDAVEEAMRDVVDPAFLPRPLRLVDALPRNEVGKLPRESVLEALRR